ncbi:CRISPR-associated endonuclease Cas2 [Nitratireductor rhodophyticola]|uniref:CRISPR-associated endonuclease Cas2 n=1 Tax=Nitratireductor rhodophyticola TaxID=2854036 RepID=UPI002AC9AA47|nr:CRISPR-associated endonuclease Cas2 [Nitratireductor rhodophyticola]WPZ13629.1 CRISPR-associated endonuclease Cas2 [Nitratireductor rhodophyticola]
MTSYLLTYDLNKEKDYGKLFAELERLGGHRTLYSVWLVAVDNTARELREHLTDYIDDDDSMWILEITNNNSYNNVRKGTNNWLKAHPPSR